MHSVVVEIEPLQLERQQVGKVQKSQPLCGDAWTQQSDRKGRQAAASPGITTPMEHLRAAYFSSIAFLLATLAEVLVGSIQSFWLDKRLQSFFL